MFIYVYRLAIDARPKWGDGVAGRKYPSLLEGFPDSRSIYGSQETSCINRKGFFMFLSYGHHKSTIMKNPSCGVLPSRQRIHIELYTAGVAPGYS